MSLAMPASNTPSLPRSAPTVQPDDSASTVMGSTQASVNSDDILRGQKTVEISHNGSTYRLQATRLGKLILTK
ncbi:MAG: hemin uptake protein HemP [Polaromonas sp.]|uniref:hemin uptake protein HemP n=1 Tax=Polaromonas sp. TaxID=1869339 RepID=UPI0025DDB2A8|nr:hemin uptake protein HemP [Polaromonas sp.]MBI2728760.1 hemin uptake protein HemP [Polaromonas sp.]